MLLDVSSADSLRTRLVRLVTVAVAVMQSTSVTKPEMRTPHAKPTLTKRY